MNETRDRVYYVYGFVRTEHCPEACSFLTGHDAGERFLGIGVDEDDAPRLWRGKKGISAILCTVDGEQFCDQSGDIKIGHLAGVAPGVVKHQSVLERAMQFGPILPLHFGTVFRSMERLDDFLFSHSGTIASFLEQIEGKREWSVQGYVDIVRCERALWLRKQAQASPEGVPTPVPESFPGDRDRHERYEAAYNWAAERCAESFKSLAPLASDSCERRLLPSEDGSEDNEMVANWAFMISANGIDDFRSLVERISNEFSSSGLSFHLSGPWPPYTFCPALDEEMMNE
jgi:hypothetical protein